MININSLSNPGIIKKLYDRFYVSNVENNQKKSSHWEEFSKNINVNIDSEGHVLSFKGYGFGELSRVVSLKGKIRSFVENGIFFIILKNKLDILIMLFRMRRVIKLFNTRLTVDLFRQICEFCVIVRYFESHSKKNVLIIGDGHGFLSAMVKEFFPDVNITLIDIGNVLLFQAINLQWIHPMAKHQLYDFDSLSGIDSLDFLYVPAEMFDKFKSLDLKYSLIINIRSMQEMNNSVIAEYFSYIRSHSEKENIFYCSNREIKVLPCGESVEYYKYPWIESDVHLIEKESVFSFFMKNEWPYFQKFDGKTKDRITKMSVIKE